jgi:hypothetical protein
LIVAKLSKKNIPFDKSETILEKFCGKVRIITKLFFTSSPMTYAEKIGLFFTIASFGVILSPISLSEADPYHIKGIFEEVKNSIPINRRFE